MLLAGGSAILIWPRPMPGRWLVLLPILAIITGLSERKIPPLRFVVMDVGQGLAVLVQTPDYTLLYDTGPRYRAGDAAKSVVLPVLRHFGVQQLDTLVVSHGDADHAGGAHTVLDAFPGVRLLAGDAVLPTILHRETCVAGQSWSQGGVRFDILHPQATAAGRLIDDNDHSCVLSIRLGASSILLPGDIERSAEAMLLRDQLIGPYTLVVAPHHGSATSSSAGFVTATQPEAIIFSTGFRNRWGFPASAVVARWRALNACILNTAATGALVFEFDEAGQLVRQSAQRIVARRLWTAGIAPSMRDGCTNSTN